MELEMAQQRAAATGTERKPMSLYAPGGGRPRLLLAEDCDPVRIVTAAMLKSMGCDVEAVVHGEHAVKCASESPFDVIVLDIEMPIMDGIAAAQSIRRMGGTAGATPLMALSAFIADSVRNGQWRDTFDVALPKPANRNELHGAVKAALLCNPGIAEDGMPSVIDEDAYIKLRHGITDDVWRVLSNAACRDIGICANQIEQIASGQLDVPIDIYAAKLAGLGRTFAAPRLLWAAERVLSCEAGPERIGALRFLLSASRSTVSILHG